MMALSIYNTYGLNVKLTNSVSFQHLKILTNIWVKQHFVKKDFEFKLLYEHKKYVCKITSERTKLKIIANSFTEKLFNSGSLQ